MPDCRAGAGLPFLMLTDLMLTDENRPMPGRSTASAGRTPGPDTREQFPEPRKKTFMFITTNRIIPTAVLVAACFAFTGAALASTAAAAGPVVVSCNGLVITDVVPPGGALFVPANPAANNVILGTAGPVWIPAGAGNDTICSLGGDDRNHGQDGNDTVLSGTGNDQNFGGNGIDRFGCDAGFDQVLSGPAADIQDGTCEVFVQ